MRKMKGYRYLWTLGTAALGLTLLASAALAADADVSTERSGSIIVFPKVVWNGTRDTIIQISNTGNAMAHAHCFYVNAAPANPNLAPSVNNPPLWLETDFDIWLTKQQPTHWVASQGRRTMVVNENFGSDGAGIDPGQVPPVPKGFTGELKCIQVSDSGEPFPANKLLGKATLRRLDGDVSDYNAIALQGNPFLQAGDIGSDLELTRTANNAGEYSACPDTLLFNHFAYGVTDPVVDAFTPGCAAAANKCAITTTLTLVPCSEDFENQLPGHVHINFDIINEFEQHLSAPGDVDCWLDTPLDRISSVFKLTGFIGTLAAYTRITPASPEGGPSQGAVIGIAEETRVTSTTLAGAGSQAAFNLNIEGNRFDAATDGKGVGVDNNGINHSRPGVTDHIIVPAE